MSKIRVWSPDSSTATSRSVVFSTTFTASLSKYRPVLSRFQFQHILRPDPSNRLATFWSAHPPNWPPFSASHIPLVCAHRKSSRAPPTHSAVADSTCWAASCLRAPGSKYEIIRGTHLHVLADLHDGIGLGHTLLGHLGDVNEGLDALRDRHKAAIIHDARDLHASWSKKQ